MKLKSQAAVVVRKSAVPQLRKKKKFKKMPVKKSVVARKRKIQKCILLISKKKTPRRAPVTNLKSNHAVEVKPAKLVTKRSLKKNALVARVRIVAAVVKKRKKSAPAQKIKNHYAMKRRAVV